MFAPAGRRKPDHSSVQFKLLLFLGACFSIWIYRAFVAEPRTADPLSASVPR